MSWKRQRPLAVPSRPAKSATPGPPPKARMTTTASAPGKKKAVPIAAAPTVTIKTVTIRTAHAASSSRPPPTLPFLKPPVQPAAFPCSLKAAKRTAQAPSVGVAVAVVAVAAETQPNHKPNLAPKKRPPKRHLRSRPNCTQIHRFRPALALPIARFAPAVPNARADQKVSPPRPKHPRPVPASCPRLSFFPASRFASTAVLLNRKHRRPRPLRHRAPPAVSSRPR